MPSVYWYDVAQFEAGLKELTRIRLSPPAALASLLALYQGDFPADIATDWAVERREALFL